jgi:adenylate kinase
MSDGSLTNGTKKYRAILLFGMPGSGKGTQGTILGRLPALVHISCGDIFRKLSKFGKLHKEVLQYTSAGKLVPDELTVRIWEREIRILEMQELLIPDYHFLVLDGLPRNHEQAVMMDKFLDVIQIFNLKITDMEKARERLKARALRENRLDDSRDEVIARRIRTFYDETEGALSFYKPSLIYDVDASQTPIDVLRQIIDRLSELSHERHATPVEDTDVLVHSGL